MWVTSVLVESDRIVDAAVLQDSPPQVSTGEGFPRQALLVHILADEGRDHLDRLCAICCFGIQRTPEQQGGQIALYHPVIDLTLTEQTLLRTWLIARRWPAWARADQTLRTMLGVPDTPILLAEAARQSMIPLPTLAKAAAEERLPTMHLGDRHLIYPSTIPEAQERQLLHLAPGRPRRRRR